MVPITREYVVGITRYCRFQGAFGKRTAKSNDRPDRIIRIRYTVFPPSRLCLTESANRDEAVAGPIALNVETIVCPSPFTAPSERLLGAELDIKRKIHPV